MNAKRVAAVLAFPPTKDNHGAPMAFIHQLLKYRDTSITVDLYLFPYPNVSPEIVAQDLSVLRLASTTHIPRPNRLLRRISHWITANQNLPGPVASYAPNRAVIRQINNLQYDLVWLYPMWLVNWVKHVQHQRVLVTGPDSVSLHSLRALRHGQQISPDEIILLAKQLEQNIRLEERFSQVKARLHLVGEQDVRQFEFVTGRTEQAFFLRYPLHEFAPVKSSLVSAGRQLRVVFSGGGNTVYVGDYLDRMVSALAGQADLLAPYYTFSFVGSGYTDAVDELRAAGYVVDAHAWVENYADMLSEHHIQIFPIAVGTGSKGKVLTALACGLLTIGSAFAFENLAVNPEEHCIQYEKPEEITSLLRLILEHRESYASMAEQGAARVRVEHEPSTIASLFWSAGLD